MNKLSGTRPNTDHGKTHCLLPAIVKLSVSSYSLLPAIKQCLIIREPISLSHDTSVNLRIFDEIPCQKSFENLGI